VLFQIIDFFLAEEFDPVGDPAKSSDGRTTNHEGRGNHVAAKFVDLSANDIEAGALIIAGSARSMGFDVTGE